MPLPALPNGSPVIDQLITEMFNTEESYLRPLEAFMQATHGNQYAQNVIIQRQRAEIQQIIALSQDLLSLTQGMQKRPSISEIADFFEKNADRFSNYAPYAAHYAEYGEFLSEQNATGLGVAVNKALPGSLKATDIAITPIQRMPRYKMLLEAMQKDPNLNVDDRNKLLNAVDIVHLRTHIVNEVIRSTEEQNAFKKTSEYVSQKETLKGMISVVFDNPNQLGSILSTLTRKNAEEAQIKGAPEIKGMEEIKGAQSSVTKKSKPGFFDKAKMAVQGAALAVQNPVVSAKAASGATFYAKEVGKIKAIFQGYNLALASEIKTVKGKKKYLAGKIYVSTNGESYEFLDLKGDLKSGKFKPPINMDEFAKKRKDLAFKSSILAMLPPKYIYIYKASNPPFFITLLNDKEFIDFIKVNASKASKLIHPIATQLASVINLPGIDVDFITKGLSIGAKIANALSEKTSELQFIIQYAAQEPSLRGKVETTRLVTSINSVLAVFEDNPAFTEELSHYLVENKAKLIAAVKESKNKLALPEYINNELIDAVMDSGVESLPALLPLAILFGREVLQKPGSADLLTQFLQLGTDKKAVKAAAKAGAAGVKSSALAPQILGALGSKGIKDLLDTIKPLVQPIINVSTKKVSSLADLTHQAVNMSLMSDKKAKASAQKTLINQASQLLLSDVEFTNALTAFFANPASVVKLAEVTHTVVEVPEVLARLTALGVNKALAVNSVPIAAKAASLVLSKPADVQAVVQYFTKETPNTPEDNATLVTHLSGLVEALQVPQAGFTEELSTYITDNHTQLRVVAKTFFNKNEELIDSAMNVAVQFSPTLVPSVLVLFKEILDREGAAEVLTVFMKASGDKKAAKAAKAAVQGDQAGEPAEPSSLRQQVLDALGPQGVNDLFITITPFIQSGVAAMQSNPKACAELAHIEIKRRSAQNKKEKAAYQKELIIKGADFVSKNAGLMNAFRAFFSDPNSDLKIQRIVEKALDTPVLTQQLADLGIEKQLVLYALPMLGRTAGALADKTIDLQGVFKYIYPNANEPAMDQAQLLTHVSHIRDGLQAQQDVFTKTLPDYLHENEFFILNAVGKKENLTALRKNLKIPSDFTDDFIMRVAGAGIEMSQDFIPFAFKAVSATLADSNQTAILGIMEKAKKAFVPISPMVEEINGIALTKEQLKAQAKKRSLEKKAKQKEIKNLVNLVLELKDKTPELKDLINNQFPVMLAQHSELLGSLLDEFTSKTALGKYVDIRAKAYLEVASRNVPKLIDIAQLYNNKQYTRMLLKASTLLFKKGVLVLLGKTMMRALSYQYQAKSQSGLRRRLRAQRSIKKMFINILPSVSAQGKIDLGAHLTSLPRTGNSTLDYSLVNKDFRGLHFSFKPEISFKNALLDGFKFNKAKLNTSFENAQLINCNFENAVFTKKVSFKDAKIDSHTLQTLVPAIDAYNAKHKKHPERQIDKDYQIILSTEKLAKKQKPKN